MMAPETVVTVESTQATNKAPEHEHALSWLKINIEYFKTHAGILKLVQLLFAIICMATASPARLSGTHWFLFVVVISFIATLLWTSAYLLSIRDAYKSRFNWLLMELLSTAISTLLYIIAFIVQLSIWSPAYPFYRASNLTAGCFGLFNTIAYAAGTYLLYQEHKGVAPAS